MFRNDVNETESVIGGVLVEAIMHKFATQLVDSTKIFS